MSYHKSIGIDVGIIARGINYRLDNIQSEIDNISSNAEYTPDNLSNWTAHGGCGCSSDVDTIAKALDYLAEFRVDALNRISNIESILARNNIT